MGYYHDWDLQVEGDTEDFFRFCDFGKSAVEGIRQNPREPLPEFIARIEQNLYTPSIANKDDAWMMHLLMVAGEQWHTWYNHEETMKRVSQEFPDLTFTLTASPEEVYNLPWRQVWKNGKYESYKAEITWTKKTGTQ